MKNQKFEFEIFCGAKETMDSISKRGAKALNRKTTKHQVIDRSAKYEVRKTDTKFKSSLYSLYSDKDLHAIAKEKGLIM